MKTLLSALAVAFLVITAVGCRSASDHNMTAAEDANM